MPDRDEIPVPVPARCRDVGNGNWDVEGDSDAATIEVRGPARPKMRAKIAQLINETGNNFAEA